jgi:hypothetical protein
MPQYEREQANIIQAMKMIRMFMRVDHGVGDSDLLAKKLCSQIGRSVDQKVPLGQAKDSAGPRSLISRMTSGANIAFASQAGNADARSCPQ